MKEFPWCLSRNSTPSYTNWIRTQRETLSGIMKIMKMTCLYLTMCQRCPMNFQDHTNRNHEKFKRENHMLPRDSWTNVVMIRCKTVTKSNGEKDRKKSLPRYIPIPVIIATTCRAVSRSVTRARTSPPSASDIAGMRKPEVRTLRPRYTTFFLRVSGCGG